MANITEIENSLQDTRPRATRFLNKLANFVEEKGYTNASIIGGDTFNATVPLYSGFNYGLGNVISPSPVPSLEFATFEASFYKTNNIRAYNLGVGVNIVIIQAGGAAIADFDFPVYFNLFRELPKGQLTPTGSSLQPVLITPIDRIQWTNATGFTWVNGNPSFNINLIDTIADRSFDQSLFLYDFANTNDTNANNKITLEQYSVLVGQKIGWKAQIVYDPTGLTASQITHINNLLGTNGAYAISVTLPFKLFGSLASYAI